MRQSHLRARISLRQGAGDRHFQVLRRPGHPPFYPSSGHALPDLPPYRRVPAGQPQRSPDRALPPGPSRSARPAVPVTVRGDLALISLFLQASSAQEALPRPDPGKAESRSVVGLCSEPARDPPDMGGHGFGTGQDAGRPDLGVWRTERQQQDRSEESRRVLIASDDERGARATALVQPVPGTRQRWWTCVPMLSPR